MGLTRFEGRALEAMARRMAADDPAYSRMLSSFDGQDGVVLGLPSRWTVIPLLAVAIVLAIAAVALPLAMGIQNPGTTGGNPTGGNSTSYVNQAPYVAR